MWYVKGKFAGVAVFVGLFLLVAGETIWGIVAHVLGAVLFLWK